MCANGHLALFTRCQSVSEITNRAVSQLHDVSVMEFTLVLSYSLFWSCRTLSRVSRLTLWAWPPWRQPVRNWSPAAVLRTRQRYSTTSLTSMNSKSKSATVRRRERKYYHSNNIIILAVKCYIDALPKILHKFSPLKVSLLGIGSGAANWTTLYCITLHVCAVLCLKLIESCVLQ